MAVVTVSLAGAVLPYTRLSVVLGFSPLPLSLLGAISLLPLTYLFLVQVVKTLVLSPARVALTRRTGRRQHGHASWPAFNKAL